MSLSDIQKIFEVICIKITVEIDKISAALEKTELLHFRL